MDLPTLNFNVGVGDINVLKKTGEMSILPLSGPRETKYKLATIPYNMGNMVVTLN